MESLSEPAFGDQDGMRALHKFDIGEHRWGVRAVDAVRRAVVADGVRDRDDVVFVEGALEGAAAVPARPERDSLGRHAGIGVVAMKGGEERRDVDERRLGRGRSGEG